MYSASFIEDEEEDAKKPGKEKTEEQKEKEEKWLMYGTMTFSVIFSIALFIMLPYFLAGFLRNVTTSEGVIAVAEATCTHDSVSRLSGADFQNERYSESIYVSRSGT